MNDIILFLKVFLFVSILWMLLVLTMLVTGCSGQWRVQDSNDIFKLKNNYDRNFTQGLRVSNTHSDDTGSHTYYAGQNLYTPGNKQLTEYQPTQRPYAGYLYAGYDAHYRRSPNVQDTLGFQTGIIGPHSYADQTQNTVHRLIGNRTVKGWDNQLHDELGLMVTGERAYALPVTKNVDLLNIVGGNLGNIFTQGYISSLFRCGYNLDSPFSHGGPIFPRLPSQGITYYGFTGILGRAVARNIFLDGNTFRDSASIDKYPLVAEGRIGFAVKYKGYKITYTYIAQGKEFKGEDGGSDFGEVSIELGV